MENLMMEAASTSETSVSLYESTRRNIPEDSHFHTHRGDYLKSHLVQFTIHNHRLNEHYMQFKELCQRNQKRIILVLSVNTA
jgi:hypothetical protein